MRVDGLWGTTDGRMIPEPVPPHDGPRDHGIAQYLLLDPDLLDD